MKDFAANLSRWCDSIVARVFDQQTLVELAEFGSVPVVNSLCNLYHPCQGLADFMTISEHYSDLAMAKHRELPRELLHLAWLGHPLLGDTLYGGKPWLGMARQALHAQRLVL